MQLKRIKVDLDKMTKEGMILYYLFIDDQLLSAWWGYLDCWNYIDKELVEKNVEAQKKMDDMLTYVEYWENILDQLKKRISYQDIEDYIAENPNASKGYLFVK